MAAAALFPLLRLSRLAHVASAWKGSPPGRAARKPAQRRCASVCRHFLPRECGAFLQARPLRKKLQQEFRTCKVALRASPRSRPAWPLAAERVRSLQLRADMMRNRMIIRSFSRAPAAQESDHPGERPSGPRISRRGCALQARLNSRTRCQGAERAALSRFFWKAHGLQGAASQKSCIGGESGLGFVKIKNSRGGKRCVTGMLGL